MRRPGLHRPFANPTPESVRAFIDAIPLYRDDMVHDVTFWTDDRLRAKRDELLRRQLGWCAEASAFYRKHFADAGVDVGDVRSLDDLARLPVTTKADLMGDPAAFRLRFESPTVYDTTYVTAYTTGTTAGSPTPYEYTSHDYLAGFVAARRSGKVLYQVPGDLYYSTFPLSPLPHVASMASMKSSSYGIAFLHGFAGTPHPEFPIHRTTSDLLDDIEQYQPQTVAGIGSFLRRLFARAVSEGRDLSSIRLVLNSGESFNETMRAKVKDQLRSCGAEEVFVTATYGFTEGGMTWSPCREGGPLHACAPDQAVLEVIDEETHQPLPDGEIGLVALTHLNRRGMPLVRYLLGDRAAMTHDRCPSCGRGGESLVVAVGSAHVTRTKELLKVKGTLINPAIIHDVVMSERGILEYQVVVDREDPDDELSSDVLRLLVAVEEGDAGRGVDLEELGRRVHSATEVRPVIELIADAAQIYDPSSQFKAQRFVDRRVIS